MSTIYNYSISGDFTNASKVESYYLKTIINSDTNIGVQVVSISQDGDIVEIKMASSLTTPQKTALDSLISAYTYAPIPEPSKSIIFDAYVSNDQFHKGDYTSISTAFQAGNSSVYIRKGTYYETSDIIIPNGGQFYGEAPGYVYVILLGGAKVISDAIAGNPEETTGTISMNNSTNQVVGVGTTFTNLAPGQFILIGTNYFPIASITDNTNLTTVDTYFGQNVVDQPLKANSIYSGIRITNAIFYGSTNEAIYIRGVRNSAFDSLAIYNCGKGIIMKDSADLSILSIIINHCGGDGFEIDNCYSLSLNIVNNYNNVGNGFIVKGNSFNLNIHTCTSESNGGYGFLFMDTVNLMNITDCVVKFNVNDGILMDANVRYISISSIDCSFNGGHGVHLKGKNTFAGEGFIVSNSGDGIHLAPGSMCCSVEANTITSNGGYGIHCSGESSSVLGNHVEQNVGGGAIVDDCIACAFSDNVFRDNDPKGVVIKPTSTQIIFNSNIVKQSSTKTIEIESGVTNCIVSLNILDIAVDDSSTGSIVTNNLIVSA